MSSRKVSGKKPPRPTARDCLLELKTIVILSDLRDSWESKSLAFFCFIICVSVHMCVNACDTFFRSFLHSRHIYTHLQQEFMFMFSCFHVHKWCGDNHIVSSSSPFCLPNPWPRKIKICCFVEREENHQREETWCIQLESNRITSFGMIFVDCLINVLRIMTICLCIVCTEVQISMPGHHIIFSCE